MDNMIEAKLDIFRKQQENITKVGFSVQHADIPDYLAAAALGKRYYLVLIDADDYDERGGVVKESLITEQTEGDKLRVHAVMLCKNEQFQQYTKPLYTSPGESMAKLYICDYCNIKSRSELVTDIIAQMKFNNLVQEFKNWQFEQAHTKSLSRF